MRREFENFFRVLSRRWLVLLLVYALGVALLPIAAKILPTYKASADLLIVSEALKDTTLSDPDLPSILTSSEVLGRVIDRLKLNTDPSALAKRIKTKLPPRSSVLELTYEDRDGIRAAAITNAVADEAVSYFHDIATRGYTDVLDALNQRISESQEKIAAADRVLQRASARNGFAGSEKAIDNQTNQVDQLRVQGEQISSSLAADRATESRLGEQLHRIDPIVHGEILQKDVVYQQLQAEVAKDVADLVSERASFHDSFPGLASLERRIEREHNQLKSLAAIAIKNGAGLSQSYTQTLLDGERAAALVDADRERLKSSNLQLAAEQERLQEVAGAGASINLLRAKRDAAVQQYLMLTQRLSTAQGDAAQGSSLGRLVVVSRAIPGRAKAPVKLLLAFGAVMLLLAICAAYVLDAADRRFWGVPEIENVYGRPVLVTIDESA